MPHTSKNKSRRRGMKYKPIKIKSITQIFPTIFPINQEERCDVEQDILNQRFSVYLLRFSHFSKNNTVFDIKHKSDTFNEFFLLFCYLE